MTTLKYILKKFVPVKKLAKFRLQCYVLRCCIGGTLIFFCNAIVAQNVVKHPVADAFVRSGASAGNNFGHDASLVIKAAGSNDFTRYSYLKFSLDAVSNVKTATLRIYGRNTDSDNSIQITALGIYDDSWTETGITFNNAPSPGNNQLSSAAVNDIDKYYEFDVTDFVKSQLAADKMVSLVLKDISNKNTTLTFNSNDNSANKPQLIIDTTGSLNGLPPGKSYAMIFVENPEKVTSNDHFSFSRIQVPWTRGTVYNANHEIARVRIHNNGIKPLVINNLTITNTSHFIIEKYNGADYNPSTQLPAIVSAGKYVDLMVKLIATNISSRAAVLADTLLINSNDDIIPIKSVVLHGIWQRMGEGDHEPYSQEILEAYNFNTATGFGGRDPDSGDSAKLKGDEVKPYYFLRADNMLPVSIRQIAAYHNCCTNVESFRYFLKDGGSRVSVFTHIGVDGQSISPRRSASAAASGTITPAAPFGVIIGSSNTTVPSLNPGKKLGTRVYKALDFLNNVIPNAYILANDYLGNEFTNFDFNDNMYYIENVKPYEGTVYYSKLIARPSAVNYGEVVLQDNTQQKISLINGGRVYANNSQDPSVTITSVEIAGENKSEFSVSVRANVQLKPGDSTAITVSFKPQTQGLKIAELLIHYSNSSTPRRVPLFGIAKESDVKVTAKYRVNSGAATPVSINGEVWAADNKYSFDNLEPFTNGSVHDIEATDYDVLYLTEQSSNRDKAPFRYRFPVSNGTYHVRMHFAEIYWGVGGSGFNGGEGSRVFNIQMEDQYALVNFDLTQQAGGGATAIIKDFVVTVTDGMLNIDFSANVNRPMVSAIEIYRFSKEAPNAPPPVDTTIRGKLRVYPNPTPASQINIHFPSSYKGNYDLRIYDVLGRRLYEGAVQLNGSEYLHTINAANFALQPGMYFLQVSSPDQKNDILKILIE
ncbi:MAG: DNRLRE domain-containing protein [Ginsengibacter sp.]